MRASEVHRALDHISNRFALCQVISQSVRLLHKSGEPMEITVTRALNGVECGKFRGDVVTLVPSVNIASGILFHPGDAL